MKRVRQQLLDIALWMNGNRPRPVLVRTVLELDGTPSVLPCHRHLERVVGQPGEPCEGETPTTSPSAAASCAVAPGSAREPRVNPKTRSAPLSGVAAATHGSHCAHESAVTLINESQRQPNGGPTGSLRCGRYADR